MFVLTAIFESSFDVDTLPGNNPAIRYSPPLFEWAVETRRLFRFATVTAGSTALIPTAINPDAVALLACPMLRAATSRRHEHASGKVRSVIRIL
jgi:hypothetical protein